MIDISTPVCPFVSLAASPAVILNSITGILKRGDICGYRHAPLPSLPHLNQLLTIYFPPPAPTTDKSYLDVQTFPLLSNWREISYIC